MSVAPLLRGLRSQPAVVTAAILMLSVAIGITTAAFTILDALVLRPVPFQEPKDLAHVYMGDEHGGTTSVAPTVLEAWRECPAVTAAEAANTETALVEAQNLLVERKIARITPGLFRLLGGVRPVRGRLLGRDEEDTGENAALLSEDLWRSVYSADPTLVGGRIRVNGRPLVVVGILPSGFRFPTWDTALWTRGDFTSAQPGSMGERPRAFVRFSPRMTRVEAVQRLAEAAHDADPETLRLRPRVEPVVDTIIDQVDRRAAPLFAAGVVLVFLVLCANVSGLLLVRVAAQRHDYAARAALGASRGRLVRHALGESAAIAALAVAGGGALGWVLVAVARAFLPETYMSGTLNALDIDVRALSVAAASGAAATMLIGLLPGWMATRSHALESLRVGSRGGTEARGGRTVTRALLVVEIALACALLAGATTLVRSFVRMERADRGLRTEGVTGAFILLPASAFPDPTARAAIARTIEERLRRLPGVRLVVWSRNLPPRHPNVHYGEWLTDVPGAPPVNVNVESYVVGPDYFAMYGIRILRGRGFRPGDGPGRVIVGERMARALWPDLDPVGRTCSFGRQHFEVIGLARETHFPSIDARHDLPELYMPIAEIGSYPMVSLRCDRECPSTAIIRQQIDSAHPAVKAIEVQPIEEVYRAQLARPRAAAALGVGFAGVALLAAAGGLFATLTYAVGRRRREFGIRTALGATPWRIGGLVLRESLLVGVVAILLGSVLGVAGSRAMGAILYGGSRMDLFSGALVVGLLACTLAAASWRPARSACRSDPARLLREE